MNNYNIGIYSIDNCIYCEQAKALLEAKGLQYKEQKIEYPEQREDLKKKYPNARSFPVVVIDHKWIGGFTQLSEWLRDVK